MIMEEHYYKYRSLQNLKFFIDIILNERLWAAKYTDLNDPMEGAYMADANNRTLIDLLRSEKETKRICSLSRSYKDNRLWAYYGDSHHGCCIEVSPKNQKEQPLNVKYTNELPHVAQMVNGHKLLLHKSKQWSFEKEVRFFSETDYINVKIHQVILGLKVSCNDCMFYNTLIHKINPEIKVRQISENEIVDGFSS